MPHIKIEKFDTSIFAPFEKDGVKFEAIADGIYHKINNDKKILASTNDKKFLLTIKNITSNDGSQIQMLKYDKVTRINPVDDIKKALNIFANHLELKILTSNTTISHTKAKPEISYLKEIDYFSNGEFEKISQNRDVVVEVGFGSGTQLMHLAKQNPKTLYIGLEIHNPSIEQVLKHIKIDGIDNILLLNYDARAFLEILQSNLLSSVLVHFPVPWDKKPHRRVINQDFIAQCNRTLKVGSKLHLRTDSDNYFEYSKEEFLKLKKVDIHIQKNIANEVVSKYEARWQRQEKDIYNIFMSALDISDEIEIGYEFGFGEIDFEKILNLPKPTIKKDKFFIHFEELFKINDTSYLQKVTFGDFNRPEHQYIIFDDNGSQYFNFVAPNSANIEAHKEILKYVCK
jgi:tRNA (guanine-N7-)-methyltransferase